ncbi:MAG: 30S ribosomal protein S16 [candidate division WOR-3 bacterium]
MAVKIRLRVMGKKKQRFYRIVAIESKNPRDGEYLDQIGWYNPHTKELKIDEEKIKKWQENGAILTNSVKVLLKRWKSTKTEEVSDVERSDNLHSEVSGGSA